MKKIVLFFFLIVGVASTGVGQSYYYKKGHNQNFKFSGIGLELGYFYTFQRFYNVIYLPYFGSERFNGNLIYGGRLDFHIKDGFYLRGSGNFFYDKVSTPFANIEGVSRREDIQVLFGSAALSLIYEVQYKKRYYPYIGAGAAFNQFQIKKTVEELGRPSDTNIDFDNKIQAVASAGVTYTVNGQIDIGLEGRFIYGRLMHQTPYRPFKDRISSVPIGVHGPALIATMTFRFDSRYFRRKIGKYSDNPGTSVKRFN